MRIRWCLALAAAGALLAGCSSGKPAGSETRKAAPADEARITQFYATSTQVARGDRTLLCYGVENASAVWLDPGHQELSAALSRCVELTPTENTTYKLSAQSPGGQPVTREITVTIGAPHARIVNVTISALQVKAGELVNICYTAENARSVTIHPIGHRGAAGKGCASDQPKKTTTYTVTATGPGGETDAQPVTVQVK
ncbi:MAG: hypothetical protein ABI759_04225 [Candidatus Solibacter sp.]